MPEIEYRMVRAAEDMGGIPTYEAQPITVVSDEDKIPRVVKVGMWEDDPDSPFMYEGGWEDGIPEIGIPSTTFRMRPVRTRQRRPVSYEWFSDSGTKMGMWEWEYRNR